MGFRGFSLHLIAVLVDQVETGRGWGSHSLSALLRQNSEKLNTEKSGSEEAQGVDFSGAECVSAFTFRGRLLWCYTPGFHPCMYGSLCLVILMWFKLFL